MRLIGVSLSLNAVVVVIRPGGRAGVLWPRRLGQMAGRGGGRCSGRRLGNRCPLRGRGAGWVGFQAGDKVERAGEHVEGDDPDDVDDFAVGVAERAQLRDLVVGDGGRVE